MTESKNGKLVLVIVRWGLGIMTLLAVSLASLGYSSIQSELAEQGVQLDNIERLMNAAILTDSLQGRDVNELGVKLVTHCNDGDAHNE